MVCVTAPIVMHLFMLCTIFDRKTACNLFQILFAPLPRPPPKNPLRLRFLKTRIWIWFEESAKRVDFMDHDRFLDLPKKAKNPVLDSEILILIFPKKVHTKYRRFREGSFAAHSQFYVWFPRLFDCNITVGAATPLTSKNSLVTKNVHCFGVLLSLFWLTESNASITDWSQCLFHSGPCCILHLLLQ